MLGEKQFNCEHIHIAAVKEQCLKINVCPNNEEDKKAHFDMQVQTTQHTVKAINQVNKFIEATKKQKAATRSARKAKSRKIKELESQRKMVMDSDPLIKSKQFQKQYKQALKGKSISLSPKKIISGYKDQLKAVNSQINIRMQKMRLARQCLTGEAAEHNCEDAVKNINQAQYQLPDETMDSNENIGVPARYLKCVQDTKDNRDIADEVLETTAISFGLLWTPGLGKLAIAQLGKLATQQLKLAKAKQTTKAALLKRKARVAGWKARKNATALGARGALMTDLAYMGLITEDAYTQCTENAKRLEDIRKAGDMTCLDHNTIAIAQNNIKRCDTYLKLAAIGLAPMAPALIPLAKKINLYKLATNKNSGSTETATAAAALSKTDDVTENVPAATTKVDEVAKTDDLAQTQKTADAGEATNSSMTADLPPSEFPNSTEKYIAGLKEAEVFESKNKSYANKRDFSADPETNPRAVLGIDKNAPIDRVEQSYRFGVKTIEDPKQLAKLRRARDVEMQRLGKEKKPETPTTAVANAKKEQTPAKPKAKDDDSPPSDKNEPEASPKTAKKDGEETAPKTAKDSEETAKPPSAIQSLFTLVRNKYDEFTGASVTARRIREGAVLTTTTLQKTKDVEFEETTDGYDRCVIDSTLPGCPEGTRSSFSPDQEGNSASNSPSGSAATTPGAGNSEGSTGGDSGDTPGMGVEGSADRGTASAEESEEGFEEKNIQIEVEQQLTVNTPESKTFKATAKLTGKDKNIKGAFSWECQANATKVVEKDDDDDDEEENDPVTCKDQTGKEAEFKITIARGYYDVKVTFKPEGKIKSVSKEVSFEFGEACDMDDEGDDQEVECTIGDDFIDKEAFEQPLQMMYPFKPGPRPPMPPMVQRPRVRFTTGMV